VEGREVQKKKKGRAKKPAAFPRRKELVQTDDGPTRTKERRIDKAIRKTKEPGCIMGIHPVQGKSKRQKGSVRYIKNKGGGEKSSPLTIGQGFTRWSEANEPEGREEFVKREVEECVKVN